MGRDGLAYFLARKFTDNGLLIPQRVEISREMFASLQANMVEKLDCYIIYGREIYSEAA